MENIKKEKFDVAATMMTVGALLFWAVGPIFIKLLSEYIDSFTQNLLRYCAACLFWLPFLILSVRTGKFDRSIWKKAITPAIANVGMQTLWAAAIYYLDPGFMVLLTKSSIIWIVGFSLIFFAEERPLVKSRRFWLGMLLSIAGLVGVVCFKPGFTARGSLIGILLALTAALGWAVYTVSVKICFKDVDSRNGFSVICIYTVVGLSVLAFLFGRPSKCLEIPVKAWIWVVVSGITAIGFSHVLYYAAIRRIGATVPSMVLLSSPFAVLAISNVLFSERLEVLQWLSGLVLLVGCGFSIWSQEHVGKVKNKKEKGRE